MTQLAPADSGASLGMIAPLEDLDAAFARFLRLDVANQANASLDTVRSYHSQLAAWVAWCAEHAVDARTANTDDVKRYGEDLVAHGRQPPLLSTS